MEVAVAIFLSLLIIAFGVTAIAIVPFVNFLYWVKFCRRKQETRDFQGAKMPIFDKLHSWKVGTPVGGGLLIILVVIVLFGLLFPLVERLKPYGISAYPGYKEMVVIFFSLISFGLLGLYDDLYKFFGVKRTKFFGLRLRHKLVIQIVLGLILGGLLSGWLGIGIVYVPVVGWVINLGWAYALLAAVVIVGFANAFNITDGLDGLASGLLMICLFAFWAISSSAMDTILSIFIALWIGTLVAFLYFNVYPARIWLGDVGAMSFGATLAVVSLLLGKLVALLVIGGLFVAEVTSSLVQMLSKKYLGKRVWAVAPFHLWLQHRGWEEPKIVMRAWLAGVLLAVFGLWLAVI